MLTGLIVQGICSLTMLETQLDARLGMYLHFDARLRIEHHFDARLYMGFFFDAALPGRSSFDANKLLVGLLFGASQ